MATIEIQAQLAEDEFNLYESARTVWTDMVREEMRLADSLPGVRAAIVARLLGTDNLNTGRPHSASSAEEAVLTDEAFLALKLNLRNAVHAKNRSKTQERVSYLRAKLALTLTKAAAGVS